MNKLITLNEIRSLNPCKLGWKTTLDNFGVSSSNDNKFDLIELIDTVGIEDAYYALSCVEYEILAPFLVEFGKDMLSVYNGDKEEAQSLLNLTQKYIENLETKEKLLQTSMSSKKGLYSLICNPNDNLYKISRFAVGEHMKSGNDIKTSEKKVKEKLESAYRKVFKIEDK